MVRTVEQEIERTPSSARCSHRQRVASQVGQSAATHLQTGIMSAETDNVAISAATVGMRRARSRASSDDLDALPDQKGTGVPPSANAGGRVGRGVPDVAADADPSTGYQVRVDGQDLVIGGTGAVAPLWAGLVAGLNQKLGHKVGFLNPMLYSGAGADGCNDVDTGNNGAYTAKPGWDACTGWGSPNGAALLAKL